MCCKVKMELWMLEVGRHVDAVEDIRSILRHALTRWNFKNILNLPVKTLSQVSRNLNLWEFGSWVCGLFAFLPFILKELDQALVICKFVLTPSNPKRKGNGDRQAHFALKLPFQSGVESFWYIIWPIVPDLCFFSPLFLSHSRTPHLSPSSPPLFFSLPSWLVCQNLSVCRRIVVSFEFQFDSGACIAISLDVRSWYTQKRWYCCKEHVQARLIKELNKVSPCLLFSAYLRQAAADRFDFVSCSQFFWICVHLITPWFSSPSNLNRVRWLWTNWPGPFLWLLHKVKELATTFSPLPQPLFSLLFKCISVCLGAFWCSI